MKLSLAWAQYYSSADLGKDINVAIEKIGAQLGAVEEVLDLGERYKGIVAAKIISCEKHPNADKLSVCLLDDKRKVKNVKRDSRGLVQVVCGAPNVAASQLVVWIPPGSTVPATFNKDPFVLEAKELRGVISNGMIASAAELDMGDDHSGILVLDSGKAGESLVKALELDDFIIDIENKMFTHRPDCFGQLGLARELAGIQGKKFKSPAWYKEKLVIPAAKSQLEISVKNDLPKQVPRFCVLPMEGVSVGPSPAWMRSYLARVGIKPINNIVDITNYYMMLTGQPLHAYDMDKLATGKLGVRLSHQSEKLRIIGGKEITLSDGTVVITDGHKPVGLGGVMGGADTEVDENTTNIVLEAATFDMNLTRKTAFSYGLFTDAATRFTKNQSPRQNAAVIMKAANDVARLAGGRLGKFADINHVVPENRSVHLPSELVNERLGLNLTSAQMKHLLENVEFSVKRERGKLAVTPPFWRTDIEIPEDVIEEIGRLYGYDHLPLVLPKRDLAPAEQDSGLAVKARLRNVLSAAGANEVLTYSFVHGSLFDKTGQDKSEAFEIANALSPDLQYYRLSITPSLLEKVHPNIKAGYGEFVIFELGKAHGKSQMEASSVPAELGRVAGVYASSGKVSGAPFYMAAKYVEYLLLASGLAPIFKPLETLEIRGNKLFDQMLAPFDKGRSAAVYAGDKLAGVVGEYTPQAMSGLKLPPATAGFELFLSVFGPSVGRVYSPLNKFPETTQDVCFKIASNVNFGQIDGFIWAKLDELCGPSGYGYRTGVIDIFQRENYKDHKQITWRISLWHPDRTLVSAEATKLIEQLAAAAKNKFNAELV